MLQHLESEIAWCKDLLCRENLSLFSQESIVKRINEMEIKCASLATEDDAMVQQMKLENSI